MTIYKFIERDFPKKDDWIFGIGYRDKKTPDKVMETLPPTTDEMLTLSPAEVLQDVVHLNSKRTAARDLVLIIYRNLDLRDFSPDRSLSLPDTAEFLEQLETRGVPASEMWKDWQKSGAVVSPGSVGAGFGYRPSSLLLLTV
jgi:hypothetical protein